MFQQAYMLILLRHNYKNIQCLDKQEKPTKDHILRSSPMSTKRSLLRSTNFVVFKMPNYDEHQCPQTTKFTKIHTESTKLHILRRTRKTTTTELLSTTELLTNRGVQNYCLPLNSHLPLNLSTSVDESSANLIDSSCNQLHDQDQVRSVYVRQ